MSSTTKRKHPATRQHITCLEAETGTSWLGTDTRHHMWTITRQPAEVPPAARFLIQLRGGPSSTHPTPGAAKRAADGLIAVQARSTR